MKRKILVLLVLLIGMALPYKVMAAGDVRVSTNNISVTPGGTATFTISADNAAGKVSISSSDPSIATASISNKGNEDSDNEMFLDKDSRTITVTGVSVGEATITVTLDDVATYDNEDLSEKTYTINVTVNNTSSSDDKNNNIDNSNNNSGDSVVTTTVTNTVKISSVKNPSTSDIKISILIIAIAIMGAIIFVGYKRLKKNKLM